MRLIKNTKLYTPEFIGEKDILIGAEKILLIEDKIDLILPGLEVIDAQGKIVTPGLIDQHIHVTGAGGQKGFASMTPPIELSQLIACGTTTVMGLLGTDGSTKSLQALYAKVKGLDQEGITAYMLTSYFAYPPLTLMESVRDDIMFIDKIIGCKIALSDERSSFPSATELLRIIGDIHVAGLLTQKKGILHVHLGGHKPGMELLLELVEKYQAPIRRISPTHVGRTKDLFNQAVRFAKLDGMIDISTGGTQFAQPYEQVLYALEQGVSMDNMTLSSDGNAGVMKKDEKGNIIGYRRAPIDLNLKQVVKLIGEGVDISEAFKLITSSPATNLSLPNKGSIAVGKDADFCFFDESLQLTDVIAKGEIMMRDKVLIKKGTFEE
ncbi:MAG: beta-aspartyl-peptidase [Chryseobacterium sp.]|nr:MAG: beta-aspartyl-peptidase [Chryseobacterium sp.]